MPALLPILLATSHILLAANTVPNLNYGPSCRGGVATAGDSRDTASCKKDEEVARASLGKVWTQYTTAQRTHCVQLTSLGGPPSYVELITCLEMTNGVSAMPDEMPTTGRRQR